MKGGMYTVCIEVDVGDPEALFQAAVAHYVTENRGCETAVQDAIDLLKDDQGRIVIRACLIQLFDPGTSPDGCEIQQSDATTVDPPDDEEAYG